jgi:hypothetical protein
MCCLMHVSDDQKSLKFMNPKQINQLELSTVINEKREMFEGMSKKKWVTVIKKSTTKNHQREKRSFINPHRSTNAVVQRQRMYHGPL